MKRYFLLPLPLIVFCLNSHAQLWKGIVAPSRAIDWSSTSPGVVGGIPSAGWTQSGSTIAACGSSGAPVTAAACGITAALTACGTNHYVQLGAGSFYLSSGIEMPSNCELRGMGPDQTFLVFSGGMACSANGAQVCFGDSNGYTWSSTPDAPGGANSASFCGDAASGGCNSTYKNGDTTIQLSNIGSTGIVNGQYIYLDQVNDNPVAASSVTGGLLVCDKQDPVDGCSLEGGAPGRCSTGAGGSACASAGGVDRNLIQIVKVVSGCASACTGTGPFSITITAGLYGQNWSSAHTPGAWWNTPSNYTVTNSGITDLSIDSTNVGTSTDSAVIFKNAFNCWYNNIRSIKPNRNHIWLRIGAHITVSNSYFYGTQNSATISYGVESFVSSDNLVVNNIFQQVTAPVEMGPATGSVFAYNFSINDPYTVADWMQQAFSWNHDAGVLYNLSEGNITTGYWSDVFHGTGGANTVFRNYASGWESGKTQDTVPVQLFAYNRVENYIGNVLGCNNTSLSYPGNCGAPYDTAYQTSVGVGAAQSIFDLGKGNSETASSCGVTGGCLVLADPYVATSLLRWGNYDVVSGSIRWLASEVPSGLTDGFANPMPASQTLPSSFWTPTKPLWWGNSIPWPPIGPDVSGGDIPGVAGHAFLNPAANCYLNTLKGAADGSGGVLNFNANICYGVSVAPAPPQNLTGTVVQL